LFDTYLGLLRDVIQLLSINFLQKTKPFTVFRRAVSWQINDDEKLYNK